MASQKDELLRAVREGDRLAREYEDEKRSSFDVLQPFIKDDIPVFFRPLDHLLGASINVQDRIGVLITTKRSLHVQRFTLAHELGHLTLGHKMAFDETVGSWMARTGHPRTLQERAADAFASALLAPRRRIAAIAKNQNWSGDDLRKPEIIYQLGLRLGLSFKATCASLEGARVMNTEQALQLSNRAGVVKKAKSAFGPFKPENNRADMWVIGEGDHGIYLEASPEDLFAVRLKENSGAGYLWQLEGPPTCRHIADAPHLPSEEVGSPIERTMLVNFAEQGLHRMQMSQRRPWNDEKLNDLNVDVDTWGQESPGLARRMREAFLAGPVPG